MSSVRVIVCVHCTGTVLSAQWNVIERNRRMYKNQARQKENKIKVQTLSVEYSRKGFFPLKLYIDTRSKAGLIYIYIGISYLSLHIHSLQLDC